MESLPLFPNYLQLRERSRIPAPLWHVLRIFSAAGVVALVALLFVQPERGLFLVWVILVPVLPLVFLTAPGLWRNVCPLAGINQIPRLFSLSRGLTLPDWLKEYSYLIAISLFFVLASSRKWLFNHSGPATAWLILGAVGAAFVGGVIFKGKSGWCSTFCPLLPVQRIYNQTPFVTVANSHCAPCVGCVKNCYDYNPHAAYLADLYDDDRYHRKYRKLFVAAFPGFILAFFTVPDPPAISVPALYLQFALYMLISAGSLFLLDSLVKVTANKITALYTAAALNLFYWFVIPHWFEAVGWSSGVFAPAASTWFARAVLLLLTLVWIARTYRKERSFVAQILPSQDVHVASGARHALRKATKNGHAEIVFMPHEKRVVVKPGRTLLEIAEGNDLPIEAGCRMGVCGADPIGILSGMESLSPVGRDERATLQRLGLGENARLACMARVSGPVAATLQLDQVRSKQPASVEDFEYDPSVQRVVIIGNGIAGVTAADHIRRRHPTCAIDVIGRERHQLYNRMAISRLIYGRSAMSGLYLLPDVWYDEHEITYWLNTAVARIHPDARRVELATGEKLPYDRLILATGSSSYVPPIAGYGLLGTFVLREAEDAMETRAFVQEYNCRRAVVAGGGLLGLEAGYALHKLGLDVTVIERSAWALHRQLDERCGNVLRRYFERLGIDILVRAETAAVKGEKRVKQIVLKDGRRLACDLLLVCAGIRPNVQLADDIGLTVQGGVVVDETMRTSNPHIFAAGDVCEYKGRIYGLWPAAVEQAEVAAVNAIGGQQVYAGMDPVTILKGVGVDLTTIGKPEPESDADITIALEDPSGHRYRKLIISAGRIVGAILLGYPSVAPDVIAAFKQGRDVSPYLSALRAGQWDVLRDSDRAQHPDNKPRLASIAVQCQHCFDRHFANVAPVGSVQSEPAGDAGAPESPGAGQASAQGGRSPAARSSREEYLEIATRFFERARDLTGEQAINDLLWTETLRRTFQAHYQGDSLGQLAKVMAAIGLIFQGARSLTWVVDRSDPRTKDLYGFVAALGAGGGGPTPPMGDAIGAAGKIIDLMARHSAWSRYLLPARVVFATGLSRDEITHLRSVDVDVYNRLLRVVGRERPAGAIESGKRGARRTTRIPYGLLRELNLAGEYVFGGTWAWGIAFEKAVTQAAERLGLLQGGQQDGVRLLQAGYAQSQYRMFRDYSLADKEARMRVAQLMALERISSTYDLIPPGFADWGTLTQAAGR